MMGAACLRDKLPLTRCLFLSWNIIQATYLGSHPGQFNWGKIVCFHVYGGKNEIKDSLFSLLLQLRAEFRLFTLAFVWAR